MRSKGTSMGTDVANLTRPGFNPQPQRVLQSGAVPAAQCRHSLATLKTNTPDEATGVTRITHTIEMKSGITHPIEMKP